MTRKQLLLMEQLLRKNRTQGAAAEDTEAFAEAAAE